MERRASTCAQEYTAELRDALALARSLGRGLILPRFACYCDRLWSGSDDIFQTGCMYPGSQARPSRRSSRLNLVAISAASRARRTPTSCRLIALWTTSSPRPHGPRRRFATATRRCCARRRASPRVAPSSTWRFYRARSMMRSRALGELPPNDLRMSRGLPHVAAQYWSHPAARCSAGRRRARRRCRFARRTPRRRQR